MACSSGSSRMPDYPSSSWCPRRCGSVSRRHSGGRILASPTILVSLACTDSKGTTRAPFGSCSLPRYEITFDSTEGCISRVSEHSSSGGRRPVCLVRRSFPLSSRRGTPSGACSTSPRQCTPSVASPRSHQPIDRGSGTKILPGFILFPPDSDLADLANVATAVHDHDEHVVPNGTRFARSIHRTRTTPPGLRMRLTTVKKLRLIAAWCLGLYLAHMYVRMGWIKFDPNGFWTPAFERWGYPVWLRWLVGGIEVAGGLLLLMPWVASYAASALGLVMVGAWVTRMRDARFVDVAWITLYCVALVWIAFEWWPFRLYRGGRVEAGRSAA